MSEVLRIGREFFKGHGLGNDYLVFREGDAGAVEPGTVAGICDRRRGVGSDGLVVLLGADRRPAEPFRLRMFNPDGSEFERSGNGLRVFGSFLASRGWVHGAPFRVRVGGDEVVMRIEERAGEGLFEVSVEMGPTVHTHEAVAFHEALLNDEGALELGVTDPVRFHPVSVGNPHAVVFRETLSSDELRSVGPALATHPGFGAGTNVQLARVVSEERVEALVWERGVGETASSGTSACAVAAAAVRTERLAEGLIEVSMPGGILSVEVSDTLEVVLRGPVQAVCTGRLEVFPRVAV